MNPNLITLSHATYTGPSGATAAATYTFMTRQYEPPVSARMVDFDIVKNQNGKFKYVYDNGPGFFRWAPFVIRCDSAFASLVGANAQAQYDNLQKMWNHPGLLGMYTPEGRSYTVHWAGESLERGFIVFPREVGDLIEYDVTVQFEEA